MQYWFSMRIRENIEPVTPDQRHAEVEYVREQYARGSVRQIWSRTDVAGACLLIEAGNESEARAVVEGLPLMQVKKLEIEACVALSPYKGFGAAGK